MHTKFETIPRLCARLTLRIKFWIKHYIAGLVQDCSNSIANTLELLQSCTEPSIFSSHLGKVVCILTLTAWISEIIYQFVTCSYAIWMVSSYHKMSMTTGDRTNNRQNYSNQQNTSFTAKQYLYVIVQKVTSIHPPAIIHKNKPQLQNWNEPNFMALL